MNQQIAISQQNYVYLIKPSEIMFCKSDNSYSHIFLDNGKEHLLSKSLSTLSKELSGDNFIRVNQSYLVNRLYIKLIDKRKKIVVLVQEEIIPFTISIKELISHLTK